MLLPPYLSITHNSDTQSMANKNDMCCVCPSCNNGNLQAQTKQNNNDLVKLPQCITHYNRITIAAKL